VFDAVIDPQGSLLIVSSFYINRHAVSNWSTM